MSRCGKNVVLLRNVPCISSSWLLRWFRFFRGFFDRMSLPGVPRVILDGVVGVGLGLYTDWFWNMGVGKCEGI